MALFTFSSFRNFLLLFPCLIFDDKFLGFCINFGCIMCSQGSYKSYITIKDQPLVDFIATTETRHKANRLSQPFVLLSGLSRRTADGGNIEHPAFKLTPKIAEKADLHGIVLKPECRISRFICHLKLV